MDVDCDGIDYKARCDAQIPSIFGSQMANQVRRKPRWPTSDRLGRSIRQKRSLVIVMFQSVCLLILTVSMQDCHTRFFRKQIGSAHRE